MPPLQCLRNRGRATPFGSAQHGARWYMAKVLSISSQVIHGYVGNSSAAFVLQRMGHEVLSVPTIILSNRPGYKAIAGERTDPVMLDAMLEAVSANGWLASIDAILTGYLPTPGHVELSARWIAEIKALNPNAIYLCDPILGDEPSGLYIGEDAAGAIRDGLVPLADILTPNCFELGWLCSRRVSDVTSAVAAARSLSRPAVLTTSAPTSLPGTLSNLLVESDLAAATVSLRRQVQAHGTGDFFAANFLAHKLNGMSYRTALRAATAAIELVLDRSEGRTELSLIETQVSWGSSDSPLAVLAALPGVTPAP
jgi:pyridoxine kinase